MIRFLLLGLLRDKSRSRLPMLVVAIGVMLTVFMHTYVNGVMGDTIETNAKFSIGHLKVTTRAYAENSSQNPNDLALLDASEMKGQLSDRYPDITWVGRINFGGIIDVPDKNGETKIQGPAMGMGLDLLTPGSKEIHRLNLDKSLIRGNLPESSGDALLSEDFSQKLKVNPGDMVTLMSSTMNGGMTFYNFRVSGTVKFGNHMMDRGTIIADISDVQQALDMNDAVGEILGFLGSSYYNQEIATKYTSDFNKAFEATDDPYAPVMRTLRQQNNMAMFVDLSSSMAYIITLIFVIAMSLVLWNAGLLGGLRRYGEIGLRLAIGEEKGHVYRTMIYESVMIGIGGSILGTAVGLLLSWWIQTKGIDISSLMKGSSIMMPSVIRTHITIPDFYLGFIPGVISTVIGTMLSGIGIYKRKTAQLFKELEV